MTCSVPVIAIPAGKCPVKLKSSEYDAVIEWAEDIISVGRGNTTTYLPSALIFFAQQFFSIFSNEYKTVSKHIEDRYGKAGNVFEVVERVNANPILPKPPTVDEDGNPLKKRRGRPPKQLYSPSTMIKQQEKTLEVPITNETPKEEVKKVKIRRK